MKQLIITESGEYSPIFEGWNQDVAPVVIAAPDIEVTIRGARFSGYGCNAFIEAADKSIFRGKKRPKVKILGCEFKGMDGELPAYKTLPWACDFGGGNLGGVDDLEFIGNRMENCGGLRYKRGDGRYFRIVGNYMKLLQMHISDGKGGWLDQNTAGELSGIPSAQFTRHAYSIGRQFDNQIEDGLIAWNLVDNREGPYQTDVFNVSGDVRRDTIVLDSNGIPISSGLVVEHNCAYGNYYIRWDQNELQPGCAFIYDNQKQFYTDTTEGYGGAIFRYNYAINCSNTPFQHASYGPGYWDSNVCVNSGEYKGQIIGWCGRGFGAFHNNPRQKVSEDIYFTRNQAAYNHTRRGLQRIDYSFFKMGGGEYPAKMIPFEGPGKNISLYPGELATVEMEETAFSQYLSLASEAGYAFENGMAIDPVFQIRAELEAVTKERNSLLQKITELKAYVENL